MMLLMIVRVGRPVGGHGTRCDQIKQASCRGGGRVRGGGIRSKAKANAEAGKKGLSKSPVRL